MSHHLCNVEFKQTIDVTKFSLIFLKTTHYEYVKKQSDIGWIHRDATRN